jgi:hypothetical protein
MDPKQLLDTWLDDIGIKHGRDLLDAIQGKPKDTVIEALTDIAKLRVQELAGVDVSSELPFAEATLANMGAAVAIKTQRTILQVLADSADMAGSVLLGAINTLLGKIPG